MSSFAEGSPMDYAWKAIVASESIPLATVTATEQAVGRVKGATMLDITKINALTSQISRETPGVTNPDKVVEFRRKHLSYSTDIGAVLLNKVLTQQAESQHLGTPEDFRVQLGRDPGLLAQVLRGVRVPQQLKELSTYMKEASQQALFFNTEGNPTKHNVFSDRSQDSQYLAEMATDARQRVRAVLEDGVADAIKKLPKNLDAGSHNTACECIHDIAVQLLMKEGLLERTLAFGPIKPDKVQQWLKEKTEADNSKPRNPFKVTAA